jgi:Molybdopterin cofactor-binding domain
MTSHRIDRLPADISRRQVMTGIAGLTLAIALDRSGFSDAAELARDTNGASLSPWVTIAPDGAISIMSPATEMGQGSMTSLPLILAEELDADWDKVRIVPMPVIEKLYGNRRSAAPSPRPAALQSQPTTIDCGSLERRCGAFSWRMRPANGGCRSKSFIRNRASSCTKTQVVGLVTARSPASLRSPRWPPRSNRSN